MIVCSINDFKNKHLPNFPIELPKFRHFLVSLSIWCNSTSKKKQMLKYGSDIHKNLPIPFVTLYIRVINIG